jgi:hypothetical protein
MRNILVVAIHRLIAVALLATTLNIQPVSAQLNGDTAEYVSATYAAKYARYYAPYALQAAAAYIDVASFDATRGPSQQPPLDGSDVKLAVASYPDDVAKIATRYIQSWQYQFGSEGYLTCFESDRGCLEAIKKDRFTLPISGGPTFHVWARTRATQKAGAACSEVSIAFRGSTVSTADWITNLDPVTGYAVDDHYRQLRRNIDAIIKKITRLDCYRRGKTQIVSVGHSLGAGLAQFSALANNPAGPRITKVFAFDPSPVTGASYVDTGVRAQNADVEVDLIYQNGEALQRLRSVPQRLRGLLRRPEPRTPCTRTVVFDVFVPTGAVALHNMPALAREMVGMTYVDGVQQAYRLPREHANCKNQYRAPATDEDANPVVSSRDWSDTRVAGANRSPLADGYAMANGFESGLASPTEMNTSDARILRARAFKNAKKLGVSISKGVARERAHTERIGGDAAWPRG